MIIDKVLAPNGITKSYHLQDDELIVERTQDVAPLLKEASDARANEASRFGDGFVKVGTIPMSVYAQMMTDGRARDPKAMAAWLEQNPAFKHITKTVVAPSQKLIVTAK